MADWQARWTVPVLHVHQSIGSTNDAARALAREGSAAGTLVIADEQVRGRGRRGRTWLGAPGDSLFLSMVIRPGSGGADAVLTLRLGLAAAAAIETAAPVAVGIKWPNDLLVGGRKVAGILCEAAFEGGRPAHVIAGIGVNVRQRDEDWPSELVGSATSIAGAVRALGGPGQGGVDLHPGEVADRLVPRWLEALDRDSGPLGASELAELSSRDVLQGRPVAVEGAPAGVAIGIASDGSLLVRSAEGVRRVASGTVRPTEDDPRPREVSS